MTRGCFTSPSIVTIRELFSRANRTPTMTLSEVALGKGSTLIFRGVVREWEIRNIRWHFLMSFFLFHIRWSIYFGSLRYPAVFLWFETLVSSYSKFDCPHFCYVSVRPWTCACFCWLWRCLGWSVGQVQGFPWDVRPHDAPPSVTGQRKGENKYVQ